jgi:Type II secretion system protein C
MKHLLSPAGILLLGLNAVLGLVFIYALLAPQSSIEVPKVALRRPPPVAIAAYTPLGAHTYDEIDRRPLFVASRRPPKIAEETAPDTNAPLPPPNLTLIGIIAGTKSQIALVKTPSSPTTASLNVGSTIDGWEVTAIESERIVLHARTADYEIRLHAKPGEQAVAIVHPAVARQTTGSDIREIR